MNLKQKIVKIITMLLLTQRLLFTNNRLDADLCKKEFEKQHKVKNFKILLIFALNFILIFNIYK